MRSPDSDSNRAVSPRANGIGIYVHIPFCVHRCSYCDFFSLTDPSEERFQVLVERIERDVEVAGRWWSRHRGDRPVARTVFFGGGTPSLLPDWALERLVNRLKKEFPWEPGAEVTTEANPESLRRDWLEEARRLGFNRVSLGAQSLHAKHLKTLERLAQPHSVRAAVALLKEQGWNRYNLDLIFGIPGQTEEEMLRDIEEVVALGPDHVSFYQLTLTRGHTLYRKLPNMDASAVFYERGMAALQKQGFEAYEVSNFARPGGECRHNQGYWEGLDYLGFGPSAASRVFHGGVFHQHKRPADWKRFLSAETWEWEVSSPAQTRLEAVYMGLRTRAGLSAEFQRQFGLELENHPKVRQFTADGFLHWEGGNLGATDAGRLLVDSIAPEIATSL